jgi:hypothetical protein
LGILSWACQCTCTIPTKPQGFPCQLTSQLVPEGLQEAFDIPNPKAEEQLFQGLLLACYRLSDYGSLWSRDLWWGL